MAEFSKILGSALTDFGAAVGEFESNQLSSYVQAAKDLAGGKSKMEVFTQLINAKQPVNFIQASKMSLQITGNLSVKSSDSVAAGGSGGVGGFTLHADFTRSSETTDQSNTVINVELARIDTNDIMQKMIDGLTGISDLVKEVKVAG